MSSTPIQAPPAAEVAQVEAAKRKAAYKAVDDHFRSEFRFVRSTNPLLPPFH
jgi:hypothetical protein